MRPGVRVFSGQYTCIGRTASEQNYGWLGEETAEISSGGNRIRTLSIGESGRSREVTPEELQIGRRYVEG